jgi:hypothetical protein
LTAKPPRAVSLYFTFMLAPDVMITLTCGFKVSFVIHSEAGDFSGTKRQVP